MIEKTILRANVKRISRRDGSEDDRGGGRPIRWAEEDGVYGVPRSGELRRAARE